MADNAYFQVIKTKGRPKLILNEQGCLTIEKLASLMCTDEEIASVLGVSVDTLTNRNNKKSFSERKEKGQLSGKASLRRLQFKIADGGNATMAIWLGKQYLGQTDKQETTLTDGNITFEITPASKETV